MHWWRVFFFVCQRTRTWKLFLFYSNDFIANRRRVLLVYWSKNRAAIWWSGCDCVPMDGWVYSLYRGDVTPPPPSVCLPMWACNQCRVSNKQKAMLNGAISLFFVSAFRSLLRVHTSEWLRKIALLVDRETIKRTPTSLQCVTFFETVNTLLVSIFIAILYANQGILPNI